MTENTQKPNQAKTKNAYAFIDSQNLNLGVQKMGWHLDWRKFLLLLQSKYNVSKAYLFIGYLAENEAMYEQLKTQGYELVYKPILEPKSAESNDGYGEELAKLTKPPVKGNVDAELVLYAMKEMPNYKNAIIVSGDGDFYCLAEYLNNKDRLAQIMTPNWQYSALLKEFDTKIVRIDQMRRQLAYRPHKSKKVRKSA